MQHGSKWDGSQQPYRLRRQNILSSYSYSKDHFCLPLPRLIMTYRTNKERRKLLKTCWSSSSLCRMNEKEKVKKKIFFLPNWKHKLSSSSYAQIFGLSELARTHIRQNSTQPDSHELGLMDRSKS